MAGFEVIAVVGDERRCSWRAERLTGSLPGMARAWASPGRGSAVRLNSPRPAAGGLAIGRATPGARTLTVVAAGVSGLSGRRALPALILGSSVFLQAHLVLGLLLGPLADRAFNQAKGPALALLAAGTLVCWRARRRSRAPAASMEAACPACIGVRVLAERARDWLRWPERARPAQGRTTSPSRW